MSDNSDRDSLLERSREHLRDVQLSFIGCGMMAESIIAGLLRQELVSPSQVGGSHPRPARREELKKTYAIRMVESNREIAQLGPDDPSAGDNSIVVLAIKPQRLAGVLAELK